MSAAKTKAPALSCRVLTCVQSKGALGKSLLASLLAEWYQFAGPFKAVDSDPVHRTLSNRYPRQASPFDATPTRDEFGLLLGRMPAVPAVIWDFPAQFTPRFLDFSDHFGMLEALSVGFVLTVWC
jgi:hypothetical protein